MRASFVDLEKVALLRGAEFGLPAAEVAFRFRDLHAFARSRADEVGLELGHHREDVEQQAADGVVRVVDGAADVELDVLGGEFVDDVFRVSKASSEPVELGDDECVPVTTGGKRFAQPWS
ncbi:hypothetical protein BIV02_08245 [Curtobacterium sp. MMLR14_014]|nr:hypothetical protein BIU91_04995 [Curtobacterium sp. MMLR14_002]OII40713.1 hypothetical protein BIV02_08245 [Curtobacterium sp. MMLR14_014]